MKANDSDNISWKDVFDEVNPDFYLDMDEDDEVPTALDLEGYCFIEYLPDISKKERRALLERS